MWQTDGEDRSGSKFKCCEFKFSLNCFIYEIISPKNDTYKVILK